MANPRELAEKAFSLLHDALKASEARVTDLDAQLKQQKPSKSKVEEQLDVLAHRLENVEAERTQWMRQAGHLEEIVETERAKVGQLRKKLEVAESGPEKLTKKEINFWRSKAEGIDSETKEYKQRLIKLRKELLERDALIEKLQQTAQPAAEHAGADAELETLRREIERLERALAETHATGSSLQADLEQARQELSGEQQRAKDAQTSGDRARETLKEREGRIAELAAQLEQGRVESSKQLEQAEQRLSAAAGREQVLRDAHDRGDEQRDEQLAELARELENLRSQSARHEQHAREAAAARHDVQAKLDESERKIEQLSGELAQVRSARDLASQQNTELEAGIQASAQQWKDELGERDEKLAQVGAELDELRQTTEVQLRELAQLRAAAEPRDRELASLRDTLQNANRELDELRAHERRLEEGLSEAVTRADAAAAERRSLEQTTEALQAELTQKSHELQQVIAQQTELESERNGVREQIAGLEAELKEEKECTENLSELANERKDQLTKLEEQVEEAEERYEEAKWRLGKAQHFERLVRRRKKLVASLIQTLRAKSKANTALKAGLDGLRTHKAAAEVNQQKLLARLDKLKMELREAQEGATRHLGATLAKEELVESQARVLELEARLNAQAELIRSLEEELKAGKALQKSGDEKNAEIDRLVKELETKSDIVDRLQADVDEQQRKLAKLRGSESETMRLKGVLQQDKSAIDALEREVAQLRAALQRRETTGAAANGHDASSGDKLLEQKLKERERSITELNRTIKDHEAAIKKLTETAESWKRKYQFLATEAPDAYKAAAEK